MLRRTPCFADYLPKPNTSFSCVVANPNNLAKNSGGYLPLCYAEHPASQIIYQHQTAIYLRSSQSIILAKTAEDTYHFATQNALLRRLSTSTKQQLPA
ncbi:MAG: hypothetical protein E7143_02025 [Rikenellaceae bacterium]|nr:hypothetical protein [Rikenellaceae bacterium]